MDAGRDDAGVVSAVDLLRMTCLWYAGIGLGVLLHEIAHTWGLT